MNVSSNSVQLEEFEMLRQLVKSMSAELAVLSQTIHQRYDGRQLWHNNSFLSLYEFPQYKGSPIYTPGFTQAKVGTYAVNQLYVEPGSGEFDKFGKQRPTYYINALYSPSDDATTGTTYLGVVYNSGDTAWMLFATSLVLLISLPGLAMLYSGMVKRKYVLTCALHVLTIACWITAWWMIFGYSLAFAPAFPNNHVNEVYGNAERLWLRGMKLRTFHFMAPTIPESVFCTYQLALAIFASVLVTGNYSDRVQYVPMTIFSSLWLLCVYCPLAHSFWHPQGFLKLLGVLDYAGGHVLHISSGASALAVTLVIGQKKKHYRGRYGSHNIRIAFMGLSMIWVGWCGLNAGGAFGANFNTGYAMLATQIATPIAALSWWLIEWAVAGQASVLGLLSGAIAGLVAISPAAGYVDMQGAFFIGLFASPLCYAFQRFKLWWSYREAMDAFGVHLSAGLVGGIATGFFATDDVVGTPQVGLLQGTSVQGVYYTGFHRGATQLAAQVMGSLFALGWSFAWSMLLAWSLELSIGFRVIKKEGYESVEGREGEEGHDEVEEKGRNDKQERQEEGGHGEGVHEVDGGHERGYEINHHQDDTNVAAIRTNNNNNNNNNNDYGYNREISINHGGQDYRQGLGNETSYYDDNHNHNRNQSRQSQQQHI